MSYLALEEPICNPNGLLTGKNIHALDLQSIPTLLESISVKQQIVYFFMLLVPSFIKKT